MDSKILIVISILFVIASALVGSNLTGFFTADSQGQQQLSLERGPDWERVCDETGCETSYYFGRRFYFEDNEWKEVRNNLERDEVNNDWKIDGNNFKVRVRDNKIRLFDKGGSSFEFEVPFSNPVVSENTISYKKTNDSIDASLVLTITSYGIDKILTIYSLDTSSDFGYSEKINSAGDRFVIGDLLIWDSSCESVEENETCPTNYYPTNWVRDGDIIKLSISKEWLVTAVFPIYIDPTTIYTFTDSTNNKAHKSSAAGNVPPLFATAYYWGGTEATSTEYTNLQTDNAVYANSTNPTAANQEPYWRFNMTVNESVSSITSINIAINGFENASEAGACYIANYTGAAFFNIGALPTADGNVLENISSGFDFYIDSNSKLVLLCQGDNFDANDYVSIDFVEVRVGFNNPPQWSNNVSSTPTEYNPNTLSKFNTTWSDDVDSNGFNVALFETNMTGTAQNFTAFRFSGTNISSFNATYPAGTFYGRFYANDSNNAFNITSNFTFTVNANTSTAANLTILPGNVTYPSSTNATCFESNPETAGNLYKNDSLANSENNTLIQRAASAYIFKCNVTSANYSTATNLSLLIVNKRPVNVSLFLNGTENNRTYDQNEVANFTARLNISTANVSLNSSYPGWIIQTNNTTIYNFTTLSTIGNNFNLTTYLNDTENNTGTQITFFFSVVISNQPPRYFNDLTSKANNTQFNPNNNYGFQINWTDPDAGDTVSVVLFETNLTGTSTNFTNSTSNLTCSPLLPTQAANCSINFTSIGANTYFYRWIANDSSNAFNATDKTVYVIVKNITNPVNLRLNNTDGNITLRYPDQVNATAWNFIIEANSGTANLFRNGTSYGNNNTFVTLSAEVHEFKANMTGNANYSDNATGVTYFAFYDKAFNQVFLELNGTLNSNRTYVYPQTVNHTGYSNATTIVWRNNSNVGNQSILLAAAIYEIKVNSSGSQNYSVNDTGVTFFAFVNRGNISIFLSISPGNTTYPTQTNTTCWKTNDPFNQAAINLFRNGSSANSENNTFITLGAASWNYVCNNSQTQNYTSNTTSSILTIDKNTSTANFIHLSFNGTTDSNRTYTYEEATNATGFKDISEGNLTLFRNGTTAGASQSKSPNETVILGNASHNYTLQFLDNGNYSGATRINYVFVNQKTIVINITLNNTAADKTYIYPAVINATGNRSTTLNNEGTLYLFRNSTQVNSSTSTIVTEVIRLANNTYNYSLNLSASNYSATPFVNRFAFVNKGNVILSLTSSPGNTTYPRATTTTCSFSANPAEDIATNLFRNNSDVNSTENGAAITLAARTYQYICNNSQTQNYSTNSTSLILVISQNTSTSQFMNLTINGTEASQTFTYPQTSNATGNFNTSVFGNQVITFTLFRNQTSIGTTNPVSDLAQFGASVVNYTYNTSGNENYSSASKLINLTITKANNLVNLFLNGTQNNNKTYFYPEAINSTGTSSSSGTTFLFRNGTQVATGSGVATEQILLASATYEYKTNATGNANISDNATGLTFFAFVNKGPVEVRLWINGTRANRTVNQFRILNFTVDTNVSGRTVELWTNFSNGVWKRWDGPSTEPLINFTDMSTQGIFNFTGNFSGDANFTSDLETWNVTVQEVDVIPPQWANNTTNPLTPTTYSPGATYQFNVTWTDNKGVSDVILEWNGTQNFTFSGGQISNTSSNYSRNMIDQAAGTYTYRWYAVDGGDNWNQTPTNNYVINKISPAGNLHIAVNGSETNQEFVYEIVTNTTGFSDLSNNQDLVYNLFRTDVQVATGDPATENVRLGIDNYTYKYNTTGGANYTSTSTTRLLNITRKALPVFIDLNGTTNANRTYTYEQAINATGYKASTINNEGTVTLLRDGSSIAGAQEIIILGNATYNYTVTVTATNYSNNQTTFFAFVNKKTISVNVSLNGTQSNRTYVYPEAINSTGFKDSTLFNEGTVFLFRNGTQIASGSSATELIRLGNASYNYSTNLSATNYSAIPLVNRYAFVSKGTPTINLTTSPGNTTYLTATTTICSSNSVNNEAPATLYRNSSNVNSTDNNIAITLAANTYQYICNTSITANYSSNSSSLILTISKANNPVDLFLNGTRNLNRTYTYPEAVNATGIATGGTASLFRDGVSVSNPELIQLAAGTFAYKVNSSGNENFSANSSDVIFSAIINKGPTLTRLFLNGTEGNKTYVANEFANFTVLLNVSGKTANLNSTYPGWNIQSGTTPLVNLTNLTTNGTYNFTGYFIADQNFSSSSQTWFATVQGAYVESDLVTPTGLTLVQEGTSFFFNTKFTCRSGNCGSISITPRAEAVVLNNSSGLRTNDPITVSCSLNKDQSCFANWTINAVSLGSYDLDANVSGGNIEPNSTADVLISVFRVITEVEIVRVGGVILGPLLDLEITNITPVVFAGGRLDFTLLLTNVGNNDTSFDALIHKRIRDFSNQIVLEEALTRSMQYNLSITDLMQIPRDFQPGRYFFELFVEYGNREAIAIATFEVKKDCFVLENTQFDLLRRRPVLISDKLDNINLVFRNICGIPLNAPVLYLDGNEIKLPPIIIETFDTTVNFDRFGGHNATIEYKEGISRILFSIENFVFNLAVIISILAVIGFGGLAFHWIIRHPEVAKRIKVPVIKIPEIKLPKISLEKLRALKLPAIKIPKIRLPEVPKIKVPEIPKIKPPVRIEIPKPIVKPQEEFIIQNKEEIEREFIRRIKRKLREGGYL